MAPRKKKSPAPQDREFKLRLPPDVSQWVEERAELERRPQNRVIINTLAAFPELEKQRKLAQLVSDMEIVLARYASRVTQTDMNEHLLAVVDQLLSANSTEISSLVEKLRVARSAMRKQ
jgi:hypothetical protein